MSLLRVQNETRGGEPLTAHFTLPPSMLTSSGADDDTGGVNGSDGARGKYGAQGEYDVENEEDEDAPPGFAIMQPGDADFGQPQRPTLAMEKLENSMLDIVDAWNWPTRGECEKNVKVFVVIRYL